MSKPLTLIFIGIGAIALFLFWNKTQNKALQTEIPIKPTVTNNTLYGFPEPTLKGSYSAQDVKDNISTGNLINQDALRQIFNNRIGVQSLDIFEDENFKGEIQAKYKPIGQAQILNPTTGKMVNPLFVGRRMETYKIVFTDKRTGKQKVRYGSKALADRLIKNYSNASVSRVS